jgi:hypothetical protein
VSASCSLGIISEINNITGPTDARSASDDCEKYSYDRNGNRAKLVKRDGSVISYQYDAPNALGFQQLTHVMFIMAMTCAACKYGRALTM